MAYCEKCGNQVNDNAAFCSACGQKRGSVGQQQNTNNYNTNTTYNGNVGYNSNFNNLNNAHPLVNELRKKIRTEAIVWIVVASIQVLLFFVNLMLEDILSAFIVLLVAVINFLVCKKDFEFEKKIATEPVGIIEKYKPIGGYIGTLIYNLILGGVVGVVGSIFCFVTRSYVMQNEQQCMELENNYKAQHRINN